MGLPKKKGTSVLFYNVKIFKILFFSNFIDKKIDAKNTAAVFYSHYEGLLFGIVVLLIGLVYTNSSSILHPIQQYKSSEVYFHQKCKSSGDIYKFSGPLNFVSAGNLKLEGTECVIDFSTVTSIDYVGVNTLLTQAKGNFFFKLIELRWAS